MGRKVDLRWLVLIPTCKDASEGCYQKNRRDRFVEVRGRPVS